MTATNPLAAYDLDWLGRLSRREVSQAGSFVVGVTGWYSILPLLLAVAVGAVAAALTITGRGVRAADCVGAAAAIGLWSVVTAVAETPDGGSHDLSYVVIVACVALLAATLVGVASIVSGLGGREDPAPQTSG